MRHLDWKNRLDGYIAAHEHTPFDWAAQNCASFAAGWVQLACGNELQLPATPDAKTALQAVKGLAGLLAAARAQLGDELPGLFAQPGDVVLLNLPRARNRSALAFGVCLGPVCAAPGPLGLLMLPITQAESAWLV